MFPTTALPPVRPTHPRYSTHRRVTAVLASDAWGLTENREGALYVEEAATKIPNPYGYGHHYENGNTTRARALARARETWGPTATIDKRITTLHYRNTDDRVCYSVHVPNPNPNPYRPSPEGYPAHSVVTAQAAQALYSATGTDWPVSGDMTAVGY